MNSTGTGAGLDRPGIRYGHRHRVVHLRQCLAPVLVRTGRRSLAGSSGAVCTTRGTRCGTGPASRAPPVRPSSDDLPELWRCDLSVSSSAARPLLLGLALMSCSTCSLASGSGRAWDLLGLRAPGAGAAGGQIEADRESLRAARGRGRAIGFAGSAVRLVPRRRGRARPRSLAPESRSKGEGRHEAGASAARTGCRRQRSGGTGDGVADAGGDGVLGGIRSASSGSSFSSPPAVHDLGNGRSSSFVAATWPAFGSERDRGGTGDVLAPGRRLGDGAAALGPGPG